MFEMPDKERILVKRTVKNVKADSLFIYDVSWIDDPITMKDMPEHEGKEIIDIRFTPVAKKQKPIRESEPISLNKKRGRPFNPKTDILPITSKHGRPNLQELYTRNLYFGKFEAFKSIISNETTKTHRLVLLKPVESSKGIVKYTCKALYTFYVTSHEIENLRKFSWTIIKKFQLYYYNANLNLAPQYLLPQHFVPKDYYSPENIEFRKLKAKRRESISKRLLRNFETDQRNLENFINIFNTFTNYKYVRNTSTDDKLKTKLFRKKQAEGDTDVNHLNPEEIIEFENEWKKAYRLISKKSLEFKKLIARLNRENPVNSKKVFNRIFHNMSLKEQLENDIYSLKELNDLEDQYMYMYENLELKENGDSTGKALIKFKEFIADFDIRDQIINDKVKEQILQTIDKDFDSLTIDEINSLYKFWPVLFQKEYEKNS